MSTTERIEELFEARLGVGATVLKTKTDTIVTFAYDPVADDAGKKWSQLLASFTESSAVRTNVKPPKRKGAQTLYRWTFLDRKPAVVLEVLKRALPTDSRVVDTLSGHWGFEPKNVIKTRGDYGEGRYEESEPI
jgi:hypothetical protein